MKVIARNNGPYYDTGTVRHPAKERRGLLEGKVYDVIEWSYQDHNIRPGHWVNRTDDFINPKEPRFWIKVINEDGVKHTYWNDYFLSSEEVRCIKLEEILE